MDLALVEWSPDRRHILFVSNKNGGTCHIYDNMAPNSTLPLYALEGDQNNERGVSIIGIHWYDGSEGHVTRTRPRWRWRSATGACKSPAASMTIAQCSSIPKCDLLSACGTETGVHWRWVEPSSDARAGRARDIGMVQFYDPHGAHLRSLKVPGGGITALSWEDGGLRRPRRRYVHLFRKHSP